MGEIITEIKATIGIYGTREIGFAFLADVAGGSEVFGNYRPGDAKLANADATEALFAACDALQSRGVSGLARVSIDRKLPDGRTATRSAFVDVSCPPWFGNLKWTETVSY